MQLVLSINRRKRVSYTEKQVNILKKINHLVILKKENTVEKVDINLILIIIIILIPLIFLLLFFKKNKTFNSVIILEKIKKINEYASHEINYFESISEEEKFKLFNKLEIPFIKRGFMLTIIGKIKIGINLDNVTVSISKNNIDIKIPEIKKLSHETKISDIGYQTKNPLYQNDLVKYNEILEEIKTQKEKEILSNNELIKNAYNDLKVKIADSLLLVPGVSKKYNLNYITEKPLLLEHQQTTIHR